MYNYYRGLSRMPGGEDYLTGRGYVIIPPNTDREAYIETVLREEKASILLEDGRGVVNDVYLTKNVLNSIEFPEEIDNLGSAVAYIYLHPNNEYVVIGTTSKADESELLQEKQFKLSRLDGDKKVVVSGLGKSSELLLEASGDKNKTATLNLKANDPNSNSKIKLESIGEIEQYSERQTKIYSPEKVVLQTLNISEGEEIKENNLTLETGKGLSYLDEFENKVDVNQDSEISIFAKNKTTIDSETEINIGTENLEAATKGDTLKSILEELIDEITKITVPTAFGPSGVPVNASIIAAIKPKLTNMLSTLTKIE